MSEAGAYRLPALAPSEVNIVRNADGTIELAHPQPLAWCAPNLGWYLAEHAAKDPVRVFLGARRADRADGGIDSITYAQAKTRVDALSQGLLDAGLGPERPLAILAENSIAFALLKLAAMQVGIPIAPISTAYTQHAAGVEKLVYLLDRLRPGMIACDGSVETQLVDARAPLIRLDDHRAFDRLAGTTPTAAVAAAVARVEPDHLAKILFTSGSTGMPKGVLTTHRMLISNIVAMRQVCPFIAGGPVLVDWLPWNHCYGGNFNFDIALINGGSYYIDPARPVEGKFDTTLLAQVPPTFYLNVPVGFERLCTVLESDVAFAVRFFSRLDAMFYAGSTMPEPLWGRLIAVSRRTLGRAVMIFTSYGSTESTPAHTMAHWPTEGPSNIGVPLPGSRVKLLPIGGQLEIRSKGGNITPGYFRDPERTQALFDADGWMITDDAVSFVDANAPERGLHFHGRIAGNFKLLTGTWVPADEIRIAAIAHGDGLVRDAIITGHDRAEIGLLVFLDPIAMDAATVSEARRRIAASLHAYNRSHPASSRRIGRFLILDEPPERYARELTDKGYLNQTQARGSRANGVAALYADPPGPEVERL